MDLVHNLKGKIVVYCLECEPDAEGRPFRYVGCTTNCERRMAEHMGMKEGGAAWCKSHKPVDVISVRVCNTKEEAAVMETMNALFSAPGNNWISTGTRKSLEHESGYEKEATIL